MEKTKPIIAYCGLYCGGCSFKVAYETNDRAHLLGMPEKYNCFKEGPLEPCEGCRADNFSSECAIRICAVDRALEHCGECIKFPCLRLEEFSNDGIPHHAEIIDNLKQLKEMGEEAWLKQQSEKWKCGCGSPASWYLKTCGSCRPIE